MKHHLKNLKNCLVLKFLAMNNIFKNYIVNNEIYVGENDWGLLKEKYDQEFIIDQISNAIEIFNIKLPYRSITLDDVEEDYNKLKNLNTNDLYQKGEWYNKFEYKHPFLDEYIGMTNIGNKASDYFHQIERWKCDATGYPSAQKTWDNEKFRLTLFKALFSLKVKEINPQILRNIISLRKYIASQFRPSAAKTIYEHFNAESVLDFSMGWGDRILGARTSNCVKNYVGFDPNINLLDGYINQIQSYHKLNGSKIINYKLFPNCAEDSSIGLNDTFDLIFTSPPYFDKEKYDHSELQSFKKYKNFDSWMKNFLFKTIELRSKNLKRGGHLVINISDIYTRKKHYKICDGMNNYIMSTNKFKYVGAIGLRMPKRPMSKSSKTNGIFAEPIWIYQKK